MDRIKIEQRVKEILADRLDIDEINIELDSNLENDLGLDSFIAVELLFELRDKLGIEIPQKDFINIKTVKDITNFIYKAKK